MGFCSFLFGRGKEETEEEPSRGLQVTLVADGEVAVPRINVVGGDAALIEGLESFVGPLQAALMRTRVLAGQPALTSEEAESLAGSLVEQTNQARTSHLAPPRRSSFWDETFRKGVRDSEIKQEIRRVVRGL